MALSDKEQLAKKTDLEQVQYKVVGEKGLHEDNHDFKKGETLWLTPRRATQINKDFATGEPSKAPTVELIKSK